MDKLLSTFIDTLNLLLFPNKEYGISYTSAIQNKLEELEGDCYTFFHNDNLLKLYETGNIPFEFIEAVGLIRNRINGLDKSLWNTSDFIDHKEWIEIRNMVVDLIKKDLIK